MSFPFDGFKPAQTGLVDMGVINFYDEQGVTPVFNPSEMGPYAKSFGEIVLNVTWDKLQPSENTLSTTLIDNAIQQLNQFNAHYGTDIGIKLRVWSGFRAPEWAKELGGTPITITGQGAVDPGNYDPQTIGRFWTADYNAAWQSLQSQLAQIYDKNPIIRGISQTAGTNATDEPFVPLHSDAPASSGSSVTVNQPALLEAGGYRDAAEALTLRAAIASYSQWSTTPLDYTFNNHSLFDGFGRLDPNFSLAVMQQARNSTHMVQAGNHALRSPLYSADVIVYNQLAADATLKPSIAPNSFQTAAPISYFPAFSDWQAAIAAGVALNAGNIELWDFPVTPVVTGFTALSPAQVQALASALGSGTPPPTAGAPDDGSALGFIAPAFTTGASGAVAFTGTNAVMLASPSGQGTYSVVLSSLGGNTLGLTDASGMTVVGATTGSTLALSGTLDQVNTVLSHLTDTVRSGSDIVRLVVTDSSGNVAVRDVGVQTATPPVSAAVPTPGTLPALQTFSIGGDSAARVVGQGTLASLDTSALGNSGILVVGGVQSSLNVAGNLTVDPNTSLVAQLSPNAYSTASLKVGGAFDVQSGANAWLSGQFSAAQFTNELGGTIRASGQLVSGDGAIRNNGTIEATADQTLGSTRLVINNNLTHTGAGTGTLQIDAGATLVLNGVVTSQTINFAANSVGQFANSPYASSTLVIGNAPALSGVTINGFTFADQLVLPSVNITGQAAPTFVGNTLTVHRQGGSDLTFTIDNTDVSTLSVNGTFSSLTNQTTITFVAPGGGISPTISVAGVTVPGGPGTLRGGDAGSQTLVPEVVLQAPLVAGADPTTTLFKLEVKALSGGAVGVNGQTPQSTIIKTGTIANLEGYLQSLIYQAGAGASDTIEIKLTNVATPAQTVTQNIGVTNGAIATPFVWAPGGGSTDFSTAANWTLSGVAQTVQPGGTNTVLFDSTTTATGHGAVGQIYTTGVATLAGGFVTAQGVGNLAVGVDSGGSLTLAGGEILLAQQQAVVGQTGRGLMTLMGGALALSGASTDYDLVIGQQANSNGTVLNLEQISANGTVVVGAHGTGTLELLGVASTVYDNNAEIGQYAGSHGSAIVNGGMWRNYGLLTVGDFGAGALTVNGMKNGITGQVMAANAMIGGHAGGQGTVTLDGGNMLIADSTAAVSTLTVGGGGSGTLNIINGSEVAVGSGYGVIANNNGSLVVGGTAGGTGLVRIGGYSSLLVYGDATIGTATGAGSVIVGQSANDDAHFALTGNLAVNANGHLTLAGSYVTVKASSVDVGNGGVISGAGTLSGVGGGNHTVALADIVNNGTIDAEGGNLLVYGGIDGQGLLKIGNNATMTLQGHVGGLQTLDFSGANAHAVLNDTHAFEGVIANFGAGDVIELASTKATNVQFGQGVLTVDTVFGEAINIRFSGNYATTSFTVQSDGLGGTNISGGFGDVHMVTFEGLHYDFQAVGEFVAVRSMDAARPWQVQIRTDGIQGVASSTTALAAQFGDAAVIFAVGQPISLHVDGAPNVALYGSTSVPGGSLTQLNANTYELHWNTGESIVVSYQGWYIDWGVKLGPHDAAGSVQGLLGSHGGPSGEFHLPDGTVLPHLPSNAEIVGQYADAWRVPGGHSLIDSHSFVDHHAVL